ncbi:hypothetical protein [Microbacterium sp. NPDC057944]|uniref:hypothetical protein n=1 Tax=Microbacterium sp. NPDC057944 TaxID=3346286 RepID=UPI0036DDD6DF
MFPRKAMTVTWRRTFIAGVALASAMVGLTGCAPDPSTPNYPATPMAPAPTSSAEPSDAGGASMDSTATACTAFNESFVTYAQLVAASGTQDEFGALGLALTQSSREAQDAGVDANVVGALSGLSVLALSRSVGDGTVDSTDEDNVIQAVLHSSSACDSAGVTISMG